MSERIPFQAVRGSEETILGLGYVDGCTYYALDTGKMFIDANGISKIPLGGSGAAVLYGKAASDATQLEDLSYNMTYEELVDSTDNPKKDDLIINKDGRFFKVVDANRETNTINYVIIAVSGTGGGGGGGNDGPIAENPVTLDIVSNIPDTFILGKESIMKVQAATATGSQITLTYTITYDPDRYKDEAPYVYVTKVASGTIHEFDAGSLLKLGTNKIVVTARDEDENTRSLTRSRPCIQLELKRSTNFTALAVMENESALSFRCMPVGAVKKTLEIYVDGKLQPSLTKTLDKNQSGADVEVEIPPQQHGIHTIKAVLSTEEGGTRAEAAPLEYEVAWAYTGNDTPLIWFDTYKSKIVENEKMLVNYMVYDPTTIESTGLSAVDFVVNNKELPQLNIEYSNVKWETWNVTNYQIGTNLLTIACRGESRTITINVEKDTERDLNILSSGLLLNLNAAGRSNKENIVSRSTWEYTNASNQTTSVGFNGFNWYNNGWIVDDNGNTCLRISNGASISVPLSVLNKTSLSMNDALTFEFEFKIRNVQNYGTLINVTTVTEGEGEDAVTKVVKTVSSTDGVWGKYYNDANSIGLCMGTQEAFFKSSATVVNARYKEDDVVNLSIVVEGGVAKPLMYIYVNGIASGVASPESSDSFKADLTEFTINSDYCDVDLYKMRVYKSALSINNVVHNFIADKKDPEMYDMNQVVTFVDNKPYVQYDMLVAYNKKYPDNTTIPYCVVEVTNDSLNRMPYVKGGKKRCNVEFINPALDRAYELGEIDGTRYVEGAPSYVATNIEFDVQGTSSQGYPRRNYKCKFKSTTEQPTTWVYTNGPFKDKSFHDKNTFNGKEYKNFYMDNATASERTFTWKVDFMESSGTHNTGFASFCQEMYETHPLQHYIADYEKGDHRTTVYGFPMFLFQKYPDGTYEFLGRYNYNLDKGCNNVIDFENESNHPFVPGKTFAEVAECWELRNNQDQRCAFRKVDFGETAVSDDPNNPDKVMPLTVTEDFEYRYSAFEDDIDDALELKGDFYTQEKANEFLREKYKNLEDLCIWLNSTNVQDAIEEVDLPAPVTYGTTTYTKDSRAYRLDKFAYEFKDHFNAEYCYVYFILTELFFCYDSRGKNMMIGTWGPQKEGGNYIWYPLFYDIDTQMGLNNSGVPSWEYDARVEYSTPNSVLWNNLWTCFAHQIKLKYIELRKNSLTEEVLNNYYDFNFEANNSYAMKGVKPISILNVDEYWKYIAPTFSGYVNTSGVTAYDNGLYFYCLQGTRELQRKLFLRSRFNFVDSQWLGGSYAAEAAKQEFKSRYNGTYFSLTSDKFLETEPADTTSADYQNFLKAGGKIQPWGQSPLDSTAEFKIKPFLSQYVSVIYDDKTTEPIPYMSGDDAVTVPMLPDIESSQRNGLNFTQQLAYIGGLEYISSLGDLSLKYFDEIELAGAVRMQELILGNETVGYMNGALKNDKFNLDAAALKDGVTNPNAKPLLEKIVLTNVGSLSSTIDVSSSEKLKIFRALGTNITDVILADGVQIHTLYLPNTINTFTLTEPVALKGLLTQKPVVNPDDDSCPAGLYIDGLTSVVGNVTSSARTKIGTIDIAGGNMDYDSYYLLKTLVDIKKIIQNDASITDYDGNLRISLSDVNWSPYRMVEAGEPKVTTSVYKKLTDHYTFESYDANSVNDATWAKDTLNGKIYQYDAALFNANQTAIRDLSLLDTFINSYKSDENYFRNLQEHADNRNTLAYLSGNVFINNVTPIDETLLKNEYIDKYYPDLKIFVNTVTPSYIAKFIEIQNEQGLEKTWDTLKYSTSVKSPEMTSVRPYKLNYDFIGWSLDPTATKAEECITDFTTLKFADAPNGIFTFYAIYKITSYEINYDVDGEITTKVCTHGTLIQEPDFIPSMNDSGLGLTETHSFIGWTQDPTKAGVHEDLEEIAEFLVTPSSIVATEPLDFYACFTIKSVYENVLADEYLVFTPYQGGWSVGLTTDIQVGGKVTLPVTHEGSPVLKVTGGQSNTADLYNAPNGMSQNTALTHIFWEKPEEARVVEVGAYAFKDCTNFVHFEVPQSLTTISEYAFANVKKMATDTWGGSIKIIKNNAFDTVEFALENGTQTLYLTGTIEELRDSAFSYIRNVKAVQIGGPGDPSKLTTYNPSTPVFSQSTWIQPHITTVTIYTNNVNDSRWDTIVSDLGFTKAAEITPDIVDANAE